MSEEIKEAALWVFITVCISALAGVLARIFGF
jgi:hypothetical protein